LVPKVSRGASGRQLMWVLKSRRIRKSSWISILVIDGLDDLGVPPFQENLHHDGISWNIHIKSYKPVLLFQWFIGVIPIYGMVIREISM